MRLRNITLAGIILIVLAFTISMAGAIENSMGNETPSVNVTGNSTETLTVSLNDTVDPEADDNQAEDESLIGPGNALYGLSIAFENIGEIFTFNASEKLGKQVSHARKRIAEARAALKRNDTEAANFALAKYEAKMSEMNGTMSGLSGNDTGLINAEQMILKHQRILENLSNSHPNSTGLLRAYKNSKNLEEKFRSKTAGKFGRIEMEDGGRILQEEQDESEDAKERTQIKAELTDNGSNVNIDLRFQTNSTNETDIVEETLDELKNLRINLSENLKLEHDDDTDVTGAPTTTLTASENEKDSKDYKVKLDVKAKVEGNFTDVKVEFKFHLNETTKSGIVDGINKKLSELNSDEVLKGLELKVLEHKKVENGKEIENSEDIEKSDSSNIVEKKGER
ncbi:Uncharacterised protein [uncultured archaeon]|nr:Uncharacterised protein [uncultured archaeon]